MFETIEKLLQPRTKSTQELENDLWRRYVKIDRAKFRIKGSALVSAIAVLLYIFGVYDDSLSDFQGAWFTAGWVSLCLLSTVVELVGIRHEKDFIDYETRLIERSSEAQRRISPASHSK